MRHLVAAALALALAIGPPAQAATPTVPGQLLIGTHYGADGNTPVRLVDAADVGTTLAGVRIADAAWSPDGSQIAFDRAVADRRADGSYPTALFVVSAAGLRQISPEDVDAASPAWSPDGSLIAWSGGPADGANHLHVVRPDGTGDRVVRSTTNAQQPSWSPDSRHLTFFTVDGVAGHPTRVFTIDASPGATQPRRELGAALTRPTTSAPVDRRPQWSPDGRLIAFTVVDKAGRTAVATSRPDGTHVKTVYAPRHGAGDFRWVGTSLVVTHHLTARASGRDELVLLGPSGRTSVLFRSTQHIYLVAYTQVPPAP